MDKLTSIQRVKDWCGITSNSDDILLLRLVESVSRQVLSHIERNTLFYESNNEYYDGHGGNRIYLRQQPVLSISQVLIDAMTVAPFTVNPMPSTQPTYGSGYILEPWNGQPPARAQALTLRGYHYNKGSSNINVQYTSGYVVQKEVQVVPNLTGNSLKVNEPYGSWGSDVGVLYANGNAFTAVTYSPTTTLSTGQYMVSGGTYFFASSDAGASVQISYSYIPADVEHATMELIAERYKYKTRIGEKSKSLGGQETVSYAIGSVPDYLKAMLEPYRNRNIFY